MDPLAADSFRSSPIRSVAEAAALTVWDVGARGGIDGALAPFAWCSGAVAFEPDPVAAEALRRSGRGPWKRLDVVEAAIAGSDGRRTLQVTADPIGSSLLAGRDDVARRYGVVPLFDVTKRVDVQTMTLATASGTHSLTPPAFLKLDVEGVELEVLRGAGGLLGDVVAIKTEAAFLPSRDDQPMAWELLGWLAERGFALMDVVGACHWRRDNVACGPYAARQGGWSRGRLAQADLILLRDRDALDDDGDATSPAMRTALVAVALGYLDHARDILDRPRAAAGFYARAGVFHTPVLADIAKAAGRRDSGRAIRARLRDLIPLLRSRFGGVPLRRR